MIAPLIAGQPVSPTRKRGMASKPLLARRANQRLAVRPALTLLEVVIALAIFLLAMTVFSQMLIRNGEITQNIQRQNQATRLCQSKLAEVVAGVVPLTTQDDTPFDEEPNYTWSLEADNGTVTGLWNVTVTVKRKPTGSEMPIQASLTEMILDPTIIGNTQDVPPPPGTNMSTNGSGSPAPTAGSGS